MFHIVIVNRLCRTMRKITIIECKTIVRLLWFFVQCSNRPICIYNHKYKHRSLFTLVTNLLDFIQCYIILQSQKVKKEMFFIYTKTHRNKRIILVNKKQKFRCAHEYSKTSVYKPVNRRKLSCSGCYNILIYTNAIPIYSGRK